MIRYVETITIAGLPMLVSLEGAGTRSACYETAAAHAEDFTPKGGDVSADVAGILSLSVLLAPWVVALIGLGWIVARDIRRLRDLARGR